MTGFCHFELPALVSSAYPQLFRLAKIISASINADESKGDANSKPNDHSAKCY
jgi:hypothetical protein